MNRLGSTVLESFSVVPVVILSNQDGSCGSNSVNVVKAEGVAILPLLFFLLPPIARGSFTCAATRIKPDPTY